MLTIITQHPYLSFDAITRRFPSIPKRTLAYDLAALMKLGLVQKYGVTRGSCYAATQ